MSYDPRAIANRFLVVAKSCGQELTPMKIQKLVYYAHGWHLAIKATSLIDEQVEAWPFGPVIPSLYHAFRHFGRLPVTAPAVIYSFRLPTTGETEEEDIEFCEKVPNINDDPEQSRFVGLLIQRIWEVYGN